MPTWRNSSPGSSNILCDTSDCQIPYQAAVVVATKLFLRLGVTPRTSRIREDGTAASEAQALRLQAEIAMHPHCRQPTIAEDCYRRALALAERCGMALLSAHCHLGLGRLHTRTNRPEQGRAHLENAVRSYREMGTAHWLAQAEAETRAWPGRPRGWSLHRRKSERPAATSGAGAHGRGEANGGGDLHAARSLCIGQASRQGSS